MLSRNPLRGFISAFVLSLVTDKGSQASAGYAPQRQTIPASSCSTGPIQCCNSVQDASSSSVGMLLGLLGIDVCSISPSTLVGLTCTPISVIGVGGNSCNAQPVCCDNTSFNGFVALGCTPVDLNL